MNNIDSTLLATAMRSTATVAWCWDRNDPERFSAAVDGCTASADCDADLRPRFSEADWRFLRSRLLASVDEGTRFQCTVNIRNAWGEDQELHLLGGADVGEDSPGHVCGLYWLGGASLQGNHGMWAPLAKLSHELRSPLTGIAQQTLELRNDADNKTVRATLDLVHENARFALRVIEDMLDAFRSEGAENQVEPVRVDTARLLAQLIPVASDRARRKGLRLSVSGEEGFPRAFWSDPVALRRILQNLLDNALKFTPSGSITLALDRLEQEGQTLLSFDVVDTGPGMSIEDAQRAFEPFQQGQAGHMSRGGLGIGLALSQQLATGLGGELLVSTAVGDGCRFRLTIPVQTMDAGSGGDGKVIELPYRPLARSVLLIDDHRLLANVTRRALIKLGCSVEVAASAGEAWKILEYATPNVVIMDLDLPDVSGCDLCRQLQQSDRLAGCRYVAYSGSEDLVDRAAAEQAGFHAYVVKPASAEELLLSSTPQVTRKAR